MVEINTKRWIKRYAETGRLMPPMLLCAEELALWLYLAKNFYLEVINEN